MTTEDKRFLGEFFTNPQFEKVLSELLSEIKADNVTYMRDLIRSENLLEAARADAVACFCEDFFSAVKGRIAISPDQPK